MFKMLIAAACVAVIAITGLLFWQAREETRRNEFAANWLACQQAVANAGPMAPSPEREALFDRLVTCRMNGMISDARWNAKIVSR